MADGANEAAEADGTNETNGADEAEETNEAKGARQWLIHSWILRLLAGGGMLRYCTQWRRDAWILRLMVAQCLDIVPNGGAMLGYCA